MTTSKKTAVRAKGTNRAKAATAAKRRESGGKAAKKATSARGSRKKTRTKPRSATQRAIKPPPTVSASNPSKSTKSARILKLLSRPNGVTLAELMTATGWQAHSVRGFLSGTVRKRLSIPLTAQVVDGERRYRINADDSPKGTP